MRTVRSKCIDCGSRVAMSSKDRRLSSEVIAFECGAVLTTVNEQGVTRVVHSGCTRDLQVAPI